MLQNMLRGPMPHLRTLIGRSATFQSLVGAGDAATAENSVHFGGVEEQDFGTATGLIAKPFPRAIVGLGKYSRTGQLQTHSWINGYYVNFEKTIDIAANEQSFSDRYMEWLGQLESILEEMFAIADAGESLNITGVETISMPGLDEDTKEGDLQIWHGEFSLQVSA